MNKPQNGVVVIINGESLVMIHLTTLILLNVFVAKLIDRINRMDSLNNYRVSLFVVATTKILTGIGFRENVQLTSVNDLGDWNVGHVRIVSVGCCGFNRLLAEIRNLRHAQKSRTVAFRIGKTNKFVGLLANFNDQAHVDIPIRGGIYDDVLDLAANQRLENLDVCFVVVHSLFPKNSR